MYNTYDDYGAYEAAAAGASAGTTIFSLIVMILILVCTWKIFQKAGEPGWAALIPIYNSYVLFKIALGNGLKFLWMLVPLVNIYFAFKVYIALAKSFGKSWLYGIGMMFISVVFFPMLAFGSDQYEGPQG